MLIDSLEVIGGLILLIWGADRFVLGAAAGARNLGVPPLLVAMTGLLFVPWAFHWVGAAARAERAVLVDHGLVVEPPKPARGCCFREIDARAATSEPAAE